jgi:diguanylate cyclase (GGDEF)-like protein/PAS domain S-box-containing protein
LVEAIVGENFSPVGSLFLSAQARPPVVMWTPRPDALRSPLLERLLDRWSALAVGGHPPSPDRAAAFVTHDLAEWTMQLDREPRAADDVGPEAFVYRHYGAGIARQYGRDMTGQRPDAFAGHIGTFFAAVYGAVMRRPEPVFTEHEPPAAVLVRCWRRLVLPFCDPDGQVVRFVVGNIPESPIGTLLDVMHDAALVTDGLGRVRLANIAAAELLGERREQVVGSAIDDLVPELKPLIVMAGRAIEGVSSLGRREVGFVRDGRHLVLDVSIGGTRAAGEPLLVLVLRDQTERVARERSLAVEVTRDPLTGILNRRGFHDRLAPLLLPNRRRSDGFALLVIDIDAFKLLNDRHGHAAGDRVLQTVAERISQALRGDDVFARWGGDEFVVALNGVTGPAALLAAADKIHHALDPDPAAMPAGRPVGLSMGGAFHPQHGQDFESVFAAADKALYAAKARGGNCLEIAAG